MGKEDIVNRILSDAEAGAAEILDEARKKAELILSGAKDHCDEETAAAKREAEAKAESIAEGRAAAARLDSNKIALAGKRQVISDIYARAHQKLCALGESESVALYARLLSENAEEGDEIELAQNFKYAKALSHLPVIAEKKLKISGVRANIDGGFILRGEKCDKDLSFDAILKADREENQAAIAARLFKKE